MKAYHNGGTDMTCGDLGYRYSFSGRHKTKEKALEWLREQTEMLENFKGFDDCEHEWVDADNEVVKAAKICLKCNDIRAK